MNRLRAAWLRTFAAVAVALLVLSSALEAQRKPAAPPPPLGPLYPPLLMQSFDDTYNLDFEEARAKAKEYIAKEPQDPGGYRALATVAWLKILFSRGGTYIDHYLGKVTKTQFNVPKPAPELDTEFIANVDKAVALSEAKVKAHPKDARAQFDLGASWAMRAAYAGSVQGSVTAAFSASRNAFNAHEEALDLDSRYVEANFIVGMYRYAVSTFALPARLVAYMAGFGGGKDRGIAMIEAASKSGAEQADALFALAIIYSREGRHWDAVERLRELQRRHPRNRLLVLEEGAALIRAGRPDTADAVLTAGLATLEKDPRERLVGELAYWHYKRGLARLHWNHRAEAGEDFEKSLANNPVGWVRGRAHVARGQLNDLYGKRAEAMNDYRLGADLCSRNNDPFCVADASRFTQRAFALK